MAWVQLTLQVPGTSAEQFEDALIATGASAVTLRDNADQPLLEPPPGATPLWDDTLVTGLFDASVDTDLLTAALCNVAGVDQLPPLKIQALEDKDWEREWMTHYQPMQFGKRLWVCPSWCPPPQPDAINLLLDPGLAFGTGTHPTTALCLEWLDGQQLEQKTLIDFGCGSGILAVAAALLGCTRVLGIDNDPQALLASKDNAARNQVTERINVYSPNAFAQNNINFKNNTGQQADAQGQADIVVANILAGTLIDLAPQISALLKTGGKLALSGILEEQTASVQAAYAPWIDFDPTRQREDWVCISGSKR
ncbi:MAG: 50S ribosomal protein L11 methyltransferase [Gammaproteobacteria bacterium]|nr:MAG: 50S ribosomal protein L11 methyltransferase [Gammaproteobacteria bacterium]